MDCAQKGISARRHSLHHRDEQPSSYLFWWQLQWNWGFLGVYDLCRWLQQSRSSAAEGLRLTGMRGEQRKRGSISWLGGLNQPEGGQSISLPALNNLGWQKQRTIWVVQGVELTSAKGSSAKGQSYLRNQQRPLPGPHTASVLQEQGIGFISCPTNWQSSAHFRQVHLKLDGIQLPC